MVLWNKWMTLVKELESACSRKRTFHWLMIVLIGFAVKTDFWGVTSLARGVGLEACYYTCLLNFFHSNAIDLEKLKLLWVTIIFKHFSGIVRVNGKCVLVADGIKIGKEGKKMPAVKRLHQDSESNSKAEYIMGHSLQAVAMLVKGLSTYFAVPLTAQIHEGVRFDCKDTRTLLDKMVEMLVGLKISEAFYLVADKYYCSGRFMKQLFNDGIYLVNLRVLSSR